MSTIKMVPPGPNTFHNGRRVPIDGMLVPATEAEYLLVQGWAPAPRPTVESIESPALVDLQDEGED